MKVSFKYAIEGSTTRSGNPGYLSGSKLLLGTLSVLSAGIAISDSNGNCLIGGTSQTPVTVPVSYGTDLSITCTLAGVTDLANFCQTSTLLSSLAGITHVGIFGNANVGVTDVPFFGFRKQQNRIGKKLIRQRVMRR